MASSFPGAIDSFTTKVDGVDDVLAAHVNDLQDSVVAIETMLDKIKWKSWKPVWSGSGSMTVKVTTLTIASYCKIGNLMPFILRGDVTLGGTASTSIFATLPETSIDNVNLTFTAQTNKPNPFTLCSAVLSGAGTQVEIRQNGSTNWTLESDVRIFVQGFIRV